MLTHGERLSFGCNGFPDGFLSIKRPLIVVGCDVEKSRNLGRNVCRELSSCSVMGTGNLFDAAHGSIVAGLP